MKLVDNKEEEQKIWEVRESGLAATAWQPGPSGQLAGV